MTPTSQTSAITAEFARRWRISAVIFVGFVLAGWLVITLAPTKNLQDYCVMINTAVLLFIAIRCFIWICISGDQVDPHTQRFEE